MKKQTTYAGKLGGWQRLLGPLLVNSAEIPHLEMPRAKLAALFAEAGDIQHQQAAHTAAKEELSQRFQGVLTDGQRLATLLRLALKEHYGIRSPKLTEFNLQPFHGKKRKKATAEASEPQDVGDVGDVSAVGDANALIDPLHS
jgi:hypothetical protein